MFYLVFSLLAFCGEDNLEDLTFQDASLKVKGSIKLAYLRTYGGLKKAFGPIINPISKVLSFIFGASKRAFWEIYIVICQSFTNWFHIVARNSKKLSAKISSIGRQKKVVRIEYQGSEKTTYNYKNEETQNSDEEKHQGKENVETGEHEEISKQESNINQSPEPVEIPDNQGTSQESEL